MDREFTQLVESLKPQLGRLLAMKPVRYGLLPRAMPIKGLYLFSEGSQHLYVGRTNGLRQRLQNHCRPGGTHFTATFALRIAGQDTGQLKASYNAAGSRTALCKESRFRKAFEQAKRRVTSPDIRFVAEADATRQALLEIYAATVLKTPISKIINSCALD